METIISIVLFVGVLYVVAFIMPRKEPTVLDEDKCDPNKGSRKRKTQIVRSYTRVLSS